MNRPTGLTQLRIRKGLEQNRRITLADTAAEMGCTPQHAWRFERAGIKTPSDDLFRGFGRALREKDIALIRRLYDEQRATTRGRRKAA